MIKYNNFIIIISSPSGAGKSTITKKLIEKDKNIELSISATTREPRDGEKDGIHYNFLTKESFKEEIEKGNFIEYAEVFGNFYGTLRSEIESKFSRNKDIILDIDWQGARQVSNQMDPKRLLKIFILPPSIKELELRLRNRATDSEEVIQKRMNKAKDEISHFNEYDYFVINDDIELAFNKVLSIIETKRIQNVEQKSLEDFISNM